MYRVMVVDDEPHVVNAIYELLMEQNAHEIEVYKAYSALEAIACLERSRMDIVISDIRMPRMNGLELMEYIRAHWADTRVIFLTGYDEFDYVYSAIAQEGVSYILKTEDDDVLLAAVEQAVQAIDRRNREMLAANRQESLLRLLRYRDVVSGFATQRLSYAHLAQRLTHLAPGVDLQADVALMAARLEVPQDNRFDLYAGIERIMAENLCGRVFYLQVDYSESNLLWLAQSAAGEGALPHAALIVQLQNASERIVEACERHWGVSISLAIAQQSVSWQDIPQKLAELIYGAGLNAGPETGMVVLHDRSAQAQDMAPPYVDYSGRVNGLRVSLEQGRHGDYQTALAQIAAELSRYTDMQDPYAGELYAHLALMLLGYVNQNRLNDRLAPAERLGLLPGFAAFASWTEAAAYLVRFSDDIIRLQQRELQHRKSGLVYSIESYIESNIAGDLSLTAISDALHYNPSYLSRMFKQMTGVNLLSFIMERRLDKAVRMLAHGNEPVYAISRSVGFDSPAYFAKVFRKTYGATPQEYREKNVRFS